jgi:hypothetical protein
LLGCARRHRGVFQIGPLDDITLGLGGGW